MSTQLTVVLDQVTSGIHIELNETASITPVNLPFPPLYRVFCVQVPQFLTIPSQAAGGEEVSPGCCLAATGEPYHIDLVKFPPEPQATRKPAQDVV